MRSRLVLLLVALSLACAGGSSSSAGGAAGSSPGATLVVQHTIAAAAPAGSLAVVGRDGLGQVVFGPDTRSFQALLEVDGVPTTVATVELDYLDGGRRVATYVTPVFLKAGERYVLQDPPRVAADDPVASSFVFLGCNRVNEKDVKGPNAPSSANVGQLLPDFQEIPLLEPQPGHLFFCGDLVMNEAAGTAVLTGQLQGWKALFAGTPLASSPVRLVPLVGNHEMVVKLPEGEVPNPPTGAVWTTEMAQWIYNHDGPTQAPPNPDGVQRDESGLSYTFQDGSRFFIVVNTDTYLGGDQPEDSGHVPLDWLAGKVAAANADPTVSDVFVFGHRPVDSPDPDNPGIAADQAVPFYQVLATPRPDGSPSKVRAYLCAHAHLWQQGIPGNVPAGSSIPQVIAGNGGSEAVKSFEKEGGYYGYTAVDLTASGRVVLRSYGRPIPNPYDAAPPQPPATLRGWMTVSP